ncbi:MAG: plastocyanin/azurin family copper-binding protein [Thermosynechococcaceae cyanobacterium]
MKQIRALLSVSLILTLSWMLCGSHPALATNLAKQNPIEVNVSLSNEAGDLKFFPDRLQFQSGKRYRLILTNTSPQKHYFTAKDFADAIWSQKVDAGNVEIKGVIHELELRPNTEADWVFVPVKSGSYRLRCTIPGHTEAGMVGTLAISG